jgi:hypothetical protein
VRNDTLFEELEGILNEARSHFQTYVDDEIVNKSNVLEKAFIDIVFFNTSHIPSRIW